MKIRPIARKYSLNESTIHHRLMRAGVVKRPNSMNDSEIALVLALRTDGLSYERIAERMSFSATTVRKVVREAKAKYPA